MKRYLLFFTAVGALTFGLASYLVTSAPANTASGQSKNVVISTVLVSVCASFVFLFMINAGDMFRDALHLRALRSFFGNLAPALVYPDFELSREARQAISGLSPQMIYRKRSDHYPGTRFVDVPNIVASNDLQAMILITTHLGRLFADSPKLLTDGSAVSDQQRSMVSFGLTSNAVTDLYLKTDPAPLFRLEDHAGDPKIVVEDEDGHSIIYGRTNDSQHGIILRYRPDPEGHPDRFWFICAGLAAAGTPAAAWALTQRWEKYHKRFRKRDFVIIFKTSNDIHSYMHSTEVHYAERSV